MFRYLRIAAAVFWTVVCLTVFAIWMRSYEHVDSLYGSFPKFGEAIFDSRPGMMGVQAQMGSDQQSFWRFESRPLFPADLTHMDLVTGRPSPRPPHFGWNSQNLPGGEVLVYGTAPDWFLVLLSGGIAFTTQYRHFSLRMIMFAATFVCVVLGIAASTSHFH
jgi:hypothetical protein